MTLDKIISISGMPGLYKAVAQTKNGYIVESLADKKRFATGPSQQAVSLRDVSIFTTGEDRLLSDVFKTMKQMPEADTAIDINADGATLRNAFKKIIPDYDEERVYASDIKKVFKWFQLVKDLPDEPAADTAAPETNDTPTV